MHAGGSIISFRPPHEGRCRCQIAAQYISGSSLALLSLRGDGFPRRIRIQMGEQNEYCRS